MTTVDERALGCIVGGAIGDAVGAPVEFDRDPAIDDMLPWHGRPPGSWTDDTEMTITTAQAVIASHRRGDDLTTALWEAYRQWRQSYDPGRAPGITCLSATAQPTPGTATKPVNDSKGCGGVMRVAPLGVACADREVAFRRAVEAAAMTHGHPMGYLPAGFLAAWVSGLVDGDDQHAAFIRATNLTHALYPSRAAELTDQLNRARRAAKDDGAARTAIVGLGEGWTGDEALAIASFCAFRYQGDPRQGILAAANHPGDSDSTASICGQVLEAARGLGAFPPAWILNVEQRETLDSLARDLVSMRR